MKKLAIVSTHPIQYYAPLFKLLHERRKIEIKVFYTLGEHAELKYDRGFGKNVAWDIPILDGYPYENVLNTSSRPGSHNFGGIINPKITGQIEEWKPDAVLVYGWAYRGHLKALRYFKNRLPVYFRGDSTVLNDPKNLKNILKRVFLTWLYRHVDHAFYVGDNNKKYYRKYGLKDKQLSLAPHAIDNARFETDRSIEVAELRSSLTISEDDILILFAGKFEPVKNVDLLLSAFINLNKPNVHLLLVGNGLNEKSLKARAAGSRTANRVHFLDFQNQSYMPVLYQATDLFCLPSISETWGLSVNEAMACGTAILASDKVGCAADLVAEGSNGAVFKASNINSIIEKLRWLTADKKLLQAYGRQSQIIIKDWNFENMAAAIEKKVLNETD